MKKILVLVAMLGVLIFGVGTASAVIGVDDYVPADNIVMPIFCEKNGTMNTLWAIADPFGFGVDLFVELYTYRSIFVIDDVWPMTDFDVYSGNCAAYMELFVPDNKKASMEYTIGGKTYYVGYFVVFGFQNVAWEYLVDLPKGFASGFTPLHIEGGIMNYDTWSEYEALNGYGVPAFVEGFFPRYLFVNTGKPETWNWWIFTFPTNSTTRYLSGIICNEDEVCFSVAIPMPNEVTVTVVKGELPPVLRPSSQNVWAGFASLQQCINYNTATNICLKSAFDVNPLLAIEDYILNVANDGQGFTSKGWAYQRSEGNSVAASWDVIHDVHTYLYYYTVDYLFVY